MRRTTGWTAAACFLFVLGVLGVPAHLALEAHHWAIESPESEDHGDSDQDRHSSADHELTAVATTIKLQAAPVEMAFVRLLETPPATPTWRPAVLAEAIGPPEISESPTRPSRAPPRL